ncbi:MAG: hypothetical protein ACJATW_002041 [Glaciecola sp.]|jgi:hypothetical protein
MQIEYTSHPFRTLSDYETGEIKEKKNATALYPNS